MKFSKKLYLCFIVFICFLVLSESITSVRLHKKHKKYHKKNHKRFHKRHNYRYTSLRSRNKGVFDWLTRDWAHIDITV